MKADSRQLRLVEACKRGDRKAQYELYSRYAKAMYNICLRMVHNEADAEDLLQQAFIDVFSKIGQYRQEATIGAWIKRIVINNCINFLKKRRLDVRSFEDYMPDPADSEPPQGLSDEERYTVKKVKQAIDQLPDGYRVVLNLYLLEGYDHKEIAEILDISEATSKSQYSRAKSKVRMLIAENEH